MGSDEHTALTRRFILSTHSLYLDVAWLGRHRLPWRVYDPQRRHTLVMVFYGDHRHRWYGFADYRLSESAVPIHSSSNTPGDHPAIPVDWHLPGSSGLAADWPRVDVAFSITIGGWAIPNRMVAALERTQPMEALKPATAFFTMYPHWIG